MSKTIIDRFANEYAFLSNFYHAPIKYNGVNYLNAESAYQAQKQPSRASEFSELSPKEAQKLGRKVRLRKDWRTARERHMLEIIRLKFASHPDLKEKLLATGEQTLIEGNYWHDNFFGNCECSKCANIKGLNVLGSILEGVRQDLIENTTEESEQLSALRQLMIQAETDTSILENIPRPNDSHMWSRLLTRQANYTDMLHIVYRTILKQLEET